MSFVRLPQELHDMVIDYLHDDKLSLFSCSLVAWPWTLSARYHLFSAIHLQDRHDYGRPLHSDLETFLERGKVAWEYARELRIEITNVSRPSPFASNHPNILQTIIRSLPNLHTLIFTHLFHITDRFFGTEADDLYHAYEPKASLPKLVICGLHSSQVFFWRHLAAFSYVGELQLLNCTQSAIDRLPKFDCANFPKIGSLMGNSQMEFVGMIPRSCVKTSLTALDIHLDDAPPGSGEGAGYFQELFASTAPNLLHLRLDFGDIQLHSGSGPHFLEQLDVSSCVSLRSIQLCIYTGTALVFHETDTYHQWTTLSYFVSELPPTIQDVAIVLLQFGENTDHIHEDVLERFEWSQLDAQFSAFKEVREVNFRLEKRIRHSDWRPSSEHPLSLDAQSQKILRELLPKLYAAGRMKFL